MSLLLDEVALAAARLAEAGVESPRTDAELIAASVHQVKRGELHTVPDSAFDARFWSDIARRAAREPLQHITGRAHFRYLELEVGPGVFVPRPETEVMTGWAIARLRDMDVAEPVVADLGTGSGRSRWPSGRRCPGPGCTRSRPTRWPGPGPSGTSPGTWRARRTRRGGSCSTPATSVTRSVELDGTVDLVISQPAVHPGRGVRSAGGRRVRPSRRAVERRGRAGRHPGRGAHRAAAAAARRPRRRRARRAAGGGGVLGVSRGTGWRDTRNNKDLAGRDRFVTAGWNP